jgi:hypothetical protein
MWTRLPLIVALSLLGVAPAEMHAEAAESRVGVVSIACDGGNKHISFNATTLGNSVTRFIQGGEVSLIGTPGALLYMVVRAQDDETKQIMTVGPGAAREGSALTGFIQVATNGVGSVPIAVDAACRPGAGQLQALVTVYFF